MRIPLSLVFQRLALAFTFLSFGIWELRAPQIWSSYVPRSIAAFGDVQALVLIHGASLCIVALGVLSGWFQRLFTTVGALMLAHLCFIMWSGEGFSDVFIRDVGLFLFACGLCADAWVNRR